jgi:predicted acylesterase/phospholipase RssA
MGTGPKRAIVLCGGGSLGSYEIGVWRFLREKNIGFDIVTGTSIGAINGAFMAAGEYERAKDNWESLTVDKVIVNGVNVPKNFMKVFNPKTDMPKLRALRKSYAKNGGVDITPFMGWLKKELPADKVKASKVRIGIVTTEFPSFHEKDVILNDVDEKDIVPYLHASSACWPVFPMYTFKKKKYIDGGYTNNLPIDLAIKLGAEEIIAVYLRAEPKVPQHPELMDLPMVKLIYANHDTGSILDFDVDVTNGNMELGYLDAGRCLGYFWGYELSIEKDESAEPLANRLNYEMASESLQLYQKARKALSLKRGNVATSMDVFIRSLEKLALWLDADYHRLYTLRDLFAAIGDLLKKAEAERAAQPKKKKFKNGALSTAESRKAFVLEAFRHLRADKKKESFLQTFKASPESFAVYHAISLLNSMKLI